MAKHYCQPCEYVAKGWPSHGMDYLLSHCPLCRKPMTDMGSRWRPGRRGRRSARDARITRRAAQKQGHGGRWTYWQRPSF